MTTMAIKLALLTILLTLISVVRSDDTVPVPPEKAKIEEWFNANVKPAADRKATLDPALAAAESAPPKIIKVAQDGSGAFKTVMEAVNSIPADNKARVVVQIGPGNYTERISIPRNKPFVTFYGDPKNMPVLVSSGTAAQYGTTDSATLKILADHFYGINLVIVNSAPRPDGKMKDPQAVAMIILSDMSAFYNCRLHGFQDTLLDDDGRHLYKDCYIEGTVDFIFGNGTTIFLNNEIHVVAGDPFNLITAHAREGDKENSGFVFIHNRVTGEGKNDTYLGRSWRRYAKVIFAYTEMAPLVKTDGWSNNNDPTTDSTVFCGEYKCFGPGASLSSRARFVKNLTDAEAQPFLQLGFIGASKWLLPPIKL